MKLFEPSGSGVGQSRARRFSGLTYHLPNSKSYTCWMFHSVFQTQLDEEYVNKTLPLELEAPHFGLLLASWKSAVVCSSLSATWDLYHFTDFTHALQCRSKPSHHVTRSTGLTGQLDKHFADEFHGADHSRVNLAFRRDFLRVRVPV